VSEYSAPSGGNFQDSHKLRPQTSGHSENSTSKPLPQCPLALSVGGGIYRAEIRFNLLESSMAGNYLKRVRARTIPAGDVNQDSLYEQAADTYGSSLDRLARAYEFNAEVRRDLLQEIHFQLWRSFAHFDGRCSLRTWVYRVAHNVATGHMIRQRRIRDSLVSIETIEAMPDSNDRGELAVTQAEALDRLSMLIQRLKPLDRQIIVSYLEGMDASSISELTGLSPANIAMKVHRIKNILKRRFVEGGLHAE
jgi:RNA polymerase sigma-70 factor (ECF subfamily)